MQSQADGTLAMLGMNDQLSGVLQAGSGRVKKMQENTQQMEDQYKALLQNIISSGSMQNPETGKPWLPSQEFLRVVEQQFTALKDELKNEKAQNENILAQAHQNVVDCNTNRQTAFEASGSGVLALQGAMQKDRGTHSSCRTGEDTDIADMEDKCKQFDDLASKCDENQDWYAQYNDASIVADASNTLQTVVAKATACKGGVDTVTATAAQCDADQTAFKKSFCDYEKHLSATCATHKSCYKLQTENLATSRASVEALEVEQKTIWRMVGKVECYLEKLENAGINSMPKQSDITACAGLTPDDSALTITYKDPVPEDNCMENAALRGDLASPKNRPGEKSWFDKEMAGLTAHNKLNDNVACAR